MLHENPHLNPTLNPLGLDGFEFVEFAAPQRGLLEPVFAAMGFAHVARHRSKDVDLWRQGEINLIANYEPRSPAAYFTAEHGPSACGMGFRVHNKALAYAELRRVAPLMLEEWSRTRQAPRHADWLHQDPENPPLAEPDALHASGS
jgi:4-hydroxyphenylpyruvate dioxygenase-like putative hemolysin